jgi:hypothetical protein
MEQDLKQREKYFRAVISTNRGCCEGEVKKGS